MRSTLRLFLLVTVALAAALLVWRVVRGPEKPAGQIVLDDVSTFRLYGRAFTLAAPARVAVDAIGSVGAQDSLEVVAWLLDARSGEAVWTMDAARARRLEGALVQATDTLALPAGRYALYLSTWGRGGTSRSLSARVFDRAAQWRNDARRWAVALAFLDGARPTDVERLRDEDDFSGRLAASADSALLWRANASGDETSPFFLVRPNAVLSFSLLGRRLGETMTVRVVDDRQQTVWALPRTDAPADARGDQHARVRVPLPAGIYQIVYHSPDRGPGRWKATPPVDPKAWGLAVHVEEGAALPFDPFASMPEILHIRADDPGRRWEVSFAVRREARVLVAAMGELVSGQVYDGGGIYRKDGTAVWELDRSNSTPAGGSDKNRQALRTLTLAPGEYVARYETDDSHHLGSWNSESSAPDHPERWGLYLFSFDPDDVRVETLPEPPAPSLPGTPDTRSDADVALPHGADVIAAIRGVGDGATRAARFRLDEETTVRIVANGEFIGDSAYDYAWIEDGDGVEAWSMKDENGDEVASNFRHVETTVRLAPGRYVLRYRTDGSTSASDFAEATRGRRDDYGAAVVKE